MPYIHAMHIAALTTYPVKSARGIPLDTAELQQQGLRHDRRWAIIDPSTGAAYTQRTLPALARIDVAIEGDTLVLAADGHGQATAQPTETEALADIWRTEVPTRAANPEASAWLTQLLNTPCTLVHQHRANSRPVTPDLARPGDVVSLADGFPLLVTTIASLDDLNRRLEHPVPMDRFRPNLVIAGAEPWAEDTWSHLETPAARLRLASPCSRCTVTTQDQRTGEKPHRTEPLKTLGTFHRDIEGRITFGLNAIPERLGTLRVGDRITSLALT